MNKIRSSTPKISSLQIAATYIGTVVGAGFASGQEIMQFFALFGIKGFVGIFISIVLFAFYGYVILFLGMHYHASSHMEIIRHAGGKKLGGLIDFLITLFLFGTLSAMAAGSGAILHEQFKIPAIVGNLLMLCVSCLTALTGISGVISAISFVVPLLLSGVFTVTILTVISKLPITIPDLTPIVSKGSLNFNWIFSAVLYASFNLLMAVAVLAPLGNQANSKIKMKKGAFLGSLGLGSGACAILLALLLNQPHAAEYEIPMVYITGKFGKPIQLIYSAILIAEIYTTAVGNLYGFSVRLAKQNTSAYKRVVICTCISSFIVSQAGFVNMVRYLYPTIGLAGLLMIGGLTLKNKGTFLHLFHFK